MSIRLDANNLLNGLGDLETKMMIATRLYAETSGQLMENDAKAKAPWKDITGNSRQTITATVESSGSSQKIILTGHTGHFKYLELAHEKRYAILWPTIQRWQGRILSGWAKVIG